MLRRQLSKPEKQALSQLRYREKFKTEALQRLADLKGLNIEKQKARVEELEQKV